MYHLIQWYNWFMRAASPMVAEFAAIRFGGAVLRNNETSAVPDGLACTGAAGAELTAGGA